MHPYSFVRPLSSIPSSPHSRPPSYTMHGSAAHALFANPELVVLLSTHLPKSDLTQCTLVCKEWSRQLQPKLWANVELNLRFFTLMRAKPSPTATAFTRNLGHIREVSLPYTDRSGL